MQAIIEILQNQILIVALIACGSAQVIKLITELIRHRKVNIKAMFSTGGMPSAHSALVGALAAGVGQSLGWSSPDFAIACLFAVIVMYDAAGVRQAAGKQAKILNQILDDMFTDAGKEFNEERLKELLGHTPFQVIVGLCLGVSVALISQSSLF